MASWRDTASQVAQDDLDGLLDLTLPFAQEMLGTRGGFFPYGASVSIDGVTQLVAGDPGQGENPRSEDVISVIVNGFTSDRDGLRAVAVVTDVRLTDYDAIRVELEHRDGQSIEVLLPYDNTRVGEGVEFGALAAAPVPPRFWP
jgi:hypothetical protein